MSLPKEDREIEPCLTSRFEVPVKMSRASSIEEDTPQRPSSTEFPASLVLPLSRPRASTTPNTPSSLRAGPSVSMDDDSASIRSFVPTVAAGDDLEAMLSEMLGSETRWRLEQEQDENDN